MAFVPMLPAQGQLPVITTQPQSQTVAAGANVTFTVTAMGAEPLFYQWRKDGTNLANGPRITGATTATLTLSNVQSTEMGSYAATITNAFGSATTSNASLTLWPLVAWGYNSAGQSTIPGGLTNVVAVAGGYYHSVALNADGSVAAWGQTNYGQTDVPLSATNVVALAAGQLHSLGLKRDGTVVAWGANSSGQGSVPAGLSNVVAIAAGESHNLALLADGRVVAWGTNDFGQTNVPAGLSSVIAVAAGWGYNLALKNDGTVVTWGNNNGSGQTNLPLDLSNVVAIAAGYAHALALKADGTVVAWGHGLYGQTNVPVDLTNVVAIAAGRRHSLALRTDGTLVAWGQNQYGQTNIPVGLRSCIRMAAGSFHNLVVEGDGRPWLTLQPMSQVSTMSGMMTTLKVGAVGVQPISYQWQRDGTNIAGATNAVLTFLAQSGAYRCVVSNALGSVTSQVATLTTQPLIIEVQPVSQTVLSGSNVSFTVRAVSTAPLSYQWQLNGTGIAGGTNSSFVLSNIQLADAGNYRCIVSNAYGVVVSQPATLTVQPLIITTQPQSQTVLALSNATFLVTASGQGPFAYQWRKGSFNLTNSDRVSGTQTATLTLSNVQPADAGGYSVVVGNGYGTLASPEAVLMVVPLVAWGNNASGQTRIPLSLTNVVAVAAGGSHSLALTAEGRVVAWGSGSATNVPGGLSNVVGIAAGAQHSLALKRDGGVVAWGYSSYGQTNVPVGLSNVVGIAAGAQHSLALKRDGGVVAWGDNRYGQVLVPTGLTHVQAIAGGMNHSLALRLDGTVVAWGPNNLGQMNVPVGLGDVVEIAAAGDHSLALRRNGTVVAWGDRMNFPPGVTDVQAVAAGLAHDLALRVDGTVVVWGSHSPAPPGLSNAVAIAAGNAHSLAILSASPLNQTSVLLQAALDTPGLRWTTSDDVPWFWQTSVTHDGLDAAQSGASSWLETTVTGPGWLSFWWRVPPETDVLDFYVDGGLRDWLRAYIPNWFSQTNYIPPGPHTVRWIHSEGEDAGWLDQVAFEPDGPVRPSQLRLVGWGDVEVPRGLTGAVAVAAGGFGTLVLRTDGTLVSSGLNLLADQRNVVAIAAGESHSMALRSDGTIIAWGYSWQGQTNVPPGLSNVVGIAAGTSHSLAVQQGGTVVAWGDNWYGQTNVPPELANVVAVAAGGYHSLALTAHGRVLAWGRNDHGQAEVPADLADVIAVAAGGYHSLALKLDGTVAAWGSNLAEDEDHEEFVAGQAEVPPGLTNVVAIAAGGYHSIALKSDGSIVAWGSDSEPRYGHRDLQTRQATVPAAVTNAVAISGGAYCSLALEGDGSPYIARPPAGRIAYTGGSATLTVGAVSAIDLSYQWQRNGVAIPGATRPSLTLTNLQLGDTAQYSVVVSNILGMKASVAAFLCVTGAPPIIVVPPASPLAWLGGQASFEASAEGSAPLAYQWRFEGNDLPGATNATLILTNLAASQQGRYSVRVTNPLGMATSSDTVLTLTQVVPWGDNSHGQTAIPSVSSNIVALAAGRWHGLALRRDGTVIAWGAGAQAYSYSYPDYGQFVVPLGLTNVVAIAAGEVHSLALRRDGTVAAWGMAVSSPSPIDVPGGLTNVTAVAAGRSHNLALNRDGTVLAWGWAYSAPNAVEVPAGLSNVVAIAAGGLHNLALKGDGTIVAWGGNDMGQCDAPPDLDNVVAIAAGGYHSLALKSDGTMVAWGENWYGQTNVPGNLRGVVAIAAGDNHSMALEANGVVIAWGSNWRTGDDDQDIFVGQATVPLGLTNIVAIAAGGLHSLALVGDGPPLITGASWDRSAYTGRAVAFAVSASGSHLLRYQWQHDRTIIVGGTNAILQLPNLQLSDAGVYSVVVANAFGSVPGGESMLRVQASQPIILVAPTNQVTFRGGSARLRVVADGSGPFEYQWFKEQSGGTNVPIVGATNAALVFTDVTLSMAGSYHVVVINAHGMVRSPPAVISVVQVAAWGYDRFAQSTVPPDLTNVLAVADGDYHSLALKADGTVVGWGSYGGTNVPPGLTNVVAVAAGVLHSLALEGDGTVVTWGDNYYGQTNMPTGLANVVAVAAGGTHSLALKSDGTVVAWGENRYGQTNVPTGLANVVAVAAGGRHSLALRADGTVVSWGKFLDARNIFVAAPVPVGLSNVVAIAAGVDHSLALRADGTVVTWDGFNFEPNNVLTNAVAITASGYYGILALKADGTVVQGSDWFPVPAGVGNVVAVAAGMSHRLALLGDGSPAVTLHPVNQTTTAGAAASLRVMAVGSGQLIYQWQFHGTNLPGATNAVLALGNLQLAQMGNYAVVVSNALGAVTSKVAQLTVLAPPTLEPLPASATAILYSNVTFTIEATGTPPLRYQWRKNGVNIPGATNSWLTITNVQVTDGGSYSVVVANIVGSVTSDPILLNVEVPQVPPGDYFTNRAALGGWTNSAGGTNRWATSEEGEPDHAGKPGGKSVWYTWTAPASGIATFRTVGSTFDTLLGVYTGTSVATLTPVARDEDRGGYLTSELRFNAVEGVEYQIAIDGFAGEEGTFILAWELEPTAEQLPQITAQPVSQTILLGGTATFLVAAQGTKLSYQWLFNGTPIPGGTNVSLTLAEVPAAWVGEYSVRVSNAQSRSVESEAATLEIGPVAGVQSQDKYQDLLAHGGSGFARWTREPKDGGDPFISVAMGTIGAQIINSSRSATQAREPIHCGVIGGSSRWLVLRPTADGTLVLDTLGSTIDTVLAAYTWTNLLSPMHLTACDDNGAPDGVRSMVRFAARRNTDYWIAVDGVNGTNGIIEINWRFGQPPVVSGPAATNQLVSRGQALAFSVVVSNAIPPAACQWFRNGLALVGATNTTLALTNLQAADGGSYTVVVSNAIEAVQRWLAWVEVEPQLAAVVRNLFDVDAEGWTVWAGAGWLPPELWSGTAGGFLRVSNPQSSDVRWLAPGRFLGNQAAAYRGRLRFDWQQSSGPPAPTNGPTVVLNGGGLTLRFQCARPVGTNWTTYQVSLREESGWQRSDGFPAFPGELQQVLSSLVSVEIQGRLSAPGQSCALDNVELLSPCTEGSVALTIRLLPGGQQVVIEWPQEGLCFQLEASAHLWPPQWATTNFAVLQSVLSNGRQTVTVLVTPGSRFFRLRK